MIENVKYHEDHCNFCFNLNKCLKEDKNIKNPKDCPIILCEYKCKKRFHACKKFEHDLLCPKIFVGCINKYYGCPFHIRREYLGIHLRTCPASVVVCTVEWNRKPLLPSSTQPFKLNPEHLDVASLNSDKSTLRDFKSRIIPGSLRSVLKTPTKKHPMMPLGVSGHRIPNSILRQAVIERDATGSDDESEEDTLSYEYAPPNSPPGLQGSLVNQLVGPTSEKNNNIPGHHDVKRSSEWDLSLTLDAITKHSGKHLKSFTFTCAKEFRRDEYGNHFKNLHGDIHTQLNGWLFRRCPMASYGCTYGLQHMYPKIEKSSTNKYKIRHNEDLDSFCPTQWKEGETDGNGDVGSYNKRSLSDLPFEVILKLTSYLDPLSLNALSLTNYKLREASATVVRSRGIVVLNWEKNLENGKWSIEGKSWMFSSSFSKIKSWEFGDVGRISSHLSTCPFYTQQINRQSKPFCYPVKEEDL